MKEKLVEINTLLDLFGSEDIRAVKRFCVQNRIPLFKLGKKVYTLETFLDLFIECELKSFVDVNFANPSEIMAAVKTDDKVRLSKLIVPEPAKDEVAKKQMRPNKKEMGKAAKNLVHKLKVA